jgi:hypothetical protein
MNTKAQPPSSREINRLPTVFTEHVKVLRRHLQAVARDRRQLTVNDARHDASRILADGRVEAFYGEWTHARALARTVRVLSENYRYIRRHRGLSR